MAERALVSVAGGIIGSVAGPLAAQEITLIWNFKKELRKLESTVSTINAVLEDAEAQQGKSSAVSNWLEKLTDVLYEADDLLDAVSTEARRREARTQGKKAKKVRMFFLKSKKLVHDLKMAHKIKDIREKLEVIKDDKNFHLEKSYAETRVRGRDTYSLLGKDEVIIGREDDKEIVIERLEANNDRNILILPIVGFGGLGKTTLAKLIYHYQKFTENFDIKMWVCVSDDFEVEIITKKILECITEEKPQNNAMDALVNLLNKKISGQRYLLVLDDVWNEDYDKWNQLENMLGGGRRGSTILVTTRSTRVAQIMHSEPYILRGLGEDASWQLFKQHAFKNDQESIDTTKRDIGMAVIRKCAGVPLALRSVGGLLYSRDLEYWMAFKNKELSTLSSNDGSNNIIPTLKLSYDKLPSRLKQCFVYCCLFPKDYEYEKITLINLWIAQGFVEPRENECLEDIGHDYFMNLLYRSFFQEPQIDDFGNVMKCKMHDLMHDLAMSVGDKVRNINKNTRFIGFHVHSNFSTLKNIAFKANRIRTLFALGFLNRIDCKFIFSNFKSLRVLDLSEGNLECVSSSISKLKQLRYLNLSKTWSLKQLPKSITKLENLQTLILFECTLLKELPRDFEKLNNLRYLDLGKCKKIKYISQGLGQLTNLQKLILFECVSLEELPRDLAKLINLKYLDLRKCNNLRYMPSELGQLSNLQLLSYTIVHKGSLSQDCGGLNELNGLNNLRGKLKIKGLSHVRDTAIKVEDMNLKQKSYLSHLSLRWSDSGDDNDSVNDISYDGLQPHPNVKHLTLKNYPNSRLPTWISSLTSLVSLKIDGYDKCQDVLPLSQLCCLKNLNLYHMKGLEYISECHGTSKFSSSSSTSLVSFPMLEHLRLRGCPNLKGWWKMNSSMEGESNGQILKATSIKEHHSFPSFHGLLNLAIFSCPMLTTLPMCPNLEELNMSGCFLTPFSSTTSFSKLKWLRIQESKELETLPEWWGQNLPSLEALEIAFPHKLKFVHSIQYLPALKRLSLYGCSKLELAHDENGMQWQGPTTLKRLQIYGCDYFMAIPKWIENCKSLEVLIISECWHFNSQRCKKETGEDWLKIAHIPYVQIR